MRFSKFLTIISACAALSACGDGGSGSAVVSTPTPTPTPTTPAFTNFASVAANTPTLVNGTTKEGTLSVNSLGGIPSANVSGGTDGTGSVNFTVNANRQITALTVTGAQSNVSFDQTSSAASVFVGTTAIATALSNSTGSNQAIYIDPYAVGFNYQSFGAWGTGLVAGSTGKYGAISAGATTAAASVPTTGTATFRGYAAAIFTNPNGDAFRYGANAAFSVNFANRSVALSTSGDVVTNINTNVAYNWTTPMSGTMTYAAGSNTFSGTLTTSTLTGIGTGSFYGPAATELGGTFVLRGAAGAMVGGFGGKQ
ncbi:transferrin-binding protein-like solute binding protein [Novosphingobium aerophilum]|uniref:Transferrin-binding protein-like solute binding protein n=1 Tax=Novosphingobium aerophilum TaxID=2839843 RepID=A0A7X1KCJ9_9SPHN|nr:transferrin-binding protein-like solute binding protein [Novosphingobium aerophilum]MBC2652354.1 transferrin-binding protein-like solute binding protein [Novosphingobium aerophilum]